MRSTVLMLTWAVALTACGGEPERPDGEPPLPGPAPAQEKPAANTVAGRVLDARGQAVADAEIHIWPAMFDGFVKTHSDAQGHYQSVALSPQTAPYYAQAYKAVTFHGRRYCLRLSGESRSDRDAFNPAEGVTRNWHWKLTGDSGDAPDVIGSEFWGGSISLGNHVNVGPDDAQWVDPGQQVELTLVPDGALIDGSPATTLVRQARVEEGLGDLPVGRYTVSAAAVNGDGSRTPLRVSMDYLEEEPGFSADLMFDGFESCGHSGTFVKTPLWLSR